MAAKMYKCKTTTKYVCNLFFQALVKLFLDLHEKHNVGLINAEVRFEDVTSTIELLVTNLSECSGLLELQPQFKRQLDSFDKVCWVHDLKCCNKLINSYKISQKSID